MTRFAIAAVLAAALSPAAGAQPAPVTVSPPVAVLPTVPAEFAGPAIPFHKSGGVIVGTRGLYPFDTGDWLLGGTEGLSRYSGSFTMIGPGGPMSAEPPPFTGTPTGRSHFVGRHGRFCR